MRDLHPFTLWLNQSYFLSSNLVGDFLCLLVCFGGRESLLIQQHNRFCRFCPLCPGDNNALKHYWKVVVKLLGPSSANLPTLPVAVYVVRICLDGSGVASLEQKPQFSGHQKVVPKNRVPILSLVQFLHCCCVCGNTLHAEGLRLVYT